MALIFHLTYVHLGFSTVNEPRSECVRVGIRRSMTVTGKGVAAAGPAQRTIGATGRLSVTVFGETSSNPTEAMALRATAQYKGTGYDGLTVIGGGSSIDLAKNIVIATTHPGPLTAYATIEGGSTKITETATSLIAIPVAAGTGSEVVCGAIIILEDGRKLGFHSRYLLPKSTICDTELTLGLPPALTTAIGMGVIAYCIETFLIPVFNPPTDGTALNDLERTWANIERATYSGTDRDARLNMMNASMQGAMMFQKGLGCVRSLSYSLDGIRVNGKTGLHHGTLDAVVLSAMLRFNETIETVVRDNRYARMCRMMNLPAGIDLAQAVHDLTARLGPPTGLCQMGVPEDALKHVVEGILLDHYHKTNLHIATVNGYRHMLTESM